MSARVRTLTLALLAALALTAMLGAASASAAAGSWWRLSTGSAPTLLPPGGEGQIDVTASDLGYEDVKASEAAPVRITDTVPAGLEVIAAGVRGYSGQGGRSGTKVECAVAGQIVTCTIKRTVIAYEGPEVVIPVKVALASGATPQNEVKIEGGEGGPLPSTVTQPLKVSSSATPFGIEKYVLAPEAEEGAADRQAGSHPFQLTTTLNLNEVREYFPSSGLQEETAPALVHDLHFVLPPGLLGNITVVPQCTSAQFSSIEAADVNQCPADTAIGVARIKLDEPNIFKGVITETVPVFNLVPDQGEPARFGIEVDKVSVLLTTAVRTGSDYAVEVSADETTTAAALLNTEVTFWGVPGDSRHNASRGWECVGHGFRTASDEPARPCSTAVQSSPKSFLTLQTSCAGVPTTTVTGDSWPDVSAGDAVLSAGASYAFPAALQSCDLLPFDPQISVEAETHAASTPSGFTVKITVPQESTLSATEPAESDVRDTTVVLPEGVQASAGAANGLLTCSATGPGFGFDGASAGLSESGQLDNEHFTPEQPSCPEASKIGTVTIRTPLLEHNLTGSVYLAAQDTEPFNSPLVLYLFAEDPVSGVRVKLAGEVQLNQSTGQITSVFRNTPQVPFQELTLHLFGGSRASQSTPALCGDHATQASFVPTDGAAAVGAASSFPITEGAEGRPCQSSLPQSFAPAVEAGSANSQAGAYSSFSLTLRHADADQPLSGISVTLPAGLAAMLSTVTPCAEPAGGAAWQCGQESLIGESSTSSGLGGTPYTLAGKVYLTAGYDGAPFGLLVSTRAKAGPFDLGIVDVRSRINVNPLTAAVTITTDPGPHGDVFPTMLKGVPVALKQLNVTVNRPQFQFNPTNCNALAVTGTLSGAQGSSAPVSYPFHAANCAALPFTPRLTAATKAQASKANGEALDIKVESAGLGQANIAKVDLQLPIALPSRLSTLQKACLEAVFDANPAACEEGSNIGYATIRTPVLKSPLIGPAYLVSHGGAAFPDVEFVLQSEGILLILDGKTDIKKGITYSRFEAAPDAPFTVFETFLPTGPHSALTAYVPAKRNFNVCGTTLTMPTEITGQNGAVLRQNTNILAAGCAAARPLSRAQLLARAMKTCKKLKKHTRRAACERLARKKYGAKAKKAKGRTRKK